MSAAGGAVLWLTGLSGSGKTTLAGALREELMARGQGVVVLDGDVLRRGVCADLGFTLADRAENVRRAAHVARLLSDAGLVVIVALISPLRSHRAQAREIVGPKFAEVFVRAPLAVCIARDPKGLYRRALDGQLPDFTGISSPYEEPAAPDLVLDTDTSSPEACGAALSRLLQA